MPTQHAALKKRQREERASHPENLALRVHRALSWLERAEQLEDDPDGQFIFLWIAFNAAYATEIDEAYRLSQQKSFVRFLGKLLELDRKRTIEGMLWTEFSGSIRVLLDNPYVFQDFWNFHNGTLPEEVWKRRFRDAKRSVFKAFERRNTLSVLAVVLTRVYTLRNQLMHGGATWRSSVNRSQLRDCNRFMMKLVPVVIELMLDNTATLWGDACYPVVGGPVAVP